MALSEEKNALSESFVDQNKFSVVEYLVSNKLPFTGILLGLALTGAGLILFRKDFSEANDKIEIIEANPAVNAVDNSITVDIEGGIEKPGVYIMANGSRIEDLLIAAGGFSADADRGWAEKFINRATKLADGQKLYIVKTGEQSTVATARNNDGNKPDQGVLGIAGTGLININTATLSELDKLPGIGQVYGQSIIEHRPYSTVDELLTKDVLKPNIYEKIKDKVSIF